MAIIIMFLFLAIEGFLFGISIWLVVFGIREWNDRRTLSVGSFAFGFLGLYLVTNTLFTVGLI